jgi:hypothetical protein
MALTRVSPQMQSRDFESVTSLLADTVLAYAGTGTEKAVAGNTVVTRSEGFSYAVAASGASDQHVTTAGGVKLYVVTSNGETETAAWGIDRTGVALDTVQLKKMLDYCALNRVDAVFNKGIYLQTSDIVLALTGQMKLLVKSRGYVEWRMNTAVGLEISLAGNYWLEDNATGNNFIGFDGISFTTTNAGTGFAMRITGNAVSGRPMRGAEFKGCQFKGRSTQSQYWAVAVAIKDLGLTSFDNCYFIADFVTKLGVGIRYSGTDATTQGANHTITSCVFRYGNQGVLFESFVEGIYIVNGDFVAGNYGISLPLTAAESGLHVSNSHFNCAVSAIDATLLYDANITGNLIYVAANKYGIDFENCARFSIVGNIFKSAGGGTTNEAGVYIRSSANDIDLGGMISSNTFHGFDIRAIWLGGASYYNNVGDNMYRGCLVRVLDQGTNNSVNRLQYARTDVFTLTGGAATEDITFAVPAGIFSAKPEAVLLAGANTEIIGSYDHAGSSATSVVVRLRKNDSTNIAAGASRVSVIMMGL